MKKLCPYDFFSQPRSPQRRLMRQQSMLIAAIILSLSGFAAANPSITGSKYDPDTYPLAGGDQTNINGTWILVGEYDIAFVVEGAPVKTHFKAREVMRIRPSGTLTSSQLQFCSFISDWNTPIAIPNSDPFFSIAGYQFTVQSMMQMRVVINTGNQDFQITGQLAARKLSSYTEKTLGSVTISAATTDFGEDKIESTPAMQSVALFSKQKFPVSCFSEMESRDKRPSFFNIFRKFIPNAPVAITSSTHSLQIAFGGHYMKVDSETLVGPNTPVGHMMELYKGVNPWTDDDIPSRTKLTTLGGPPDNFMNDLYDQTPRLSSAFHFVGLDDLRNGSPPYAEGTVILDTK